MSPFSPRKWALSLVAAGCGWSAVAQTPAPGTAPLPVPPVAPLKVGQPSSAALPDQTTPRPPTGVLVRRQPDVETTAPQTTTPTQPATQPPTMSALPQQNVQLPTAGSPTTSILPPGQVNAASPAAAAAPDLGQFLNRSETAAGVEVQRRNAIISDARIRGLRNGQFLTLGDGAPFFPARLDLDTPVSKFSPAFLKDVRAIKGPYTTLLGPGFGFLDIQTLDSPRLRQTQQQYGGSSSISYGTNGNQWNGLQSFYAAGDEWGFRGSYNVLQGNDYRDGQGLRTPASYLSHNFNFALGYDVTEDISVEFKGFRTFADDIEFPGLFFDIGRLDTEAYSLRVALRNVGPFNQVLNDVWYNGTTGTGTTRGGAKQFFVRNLLGEAFAEGRNVMRVPGVGINGRTGYSPFFFEDRSSSTFAERSIGARTVGVWGNDRDELTVKMGADINVFGQVLNESIRFNQVGGPNTTNPALVDPLGRGLNTLLTLPNGLPNPNLGRPITPGTPAAFGQDQGIPASNSVNPGIFFEAMAPVVKQFVIKTGGRFDHVHTSSNRRRIDGNVDLFNGVPGVGPVVGFNGTRTSFDPIVYSANPGNNDLGRDFFLLNGFVTGEFNLSKETVLFVGYGYAERAPTLTELYAAGPFIGVLQQGTSRLIGDPNLDKERLNQFDVGVRYEGKNVRAGVGGFYSLINDYITYDANKLSTTGLTQVVYTNTDLATLAGTEMYLLANVGEYFSPFATLSYVQGFDQTHADRRRPGNLASSRRNDPATRQFARETEALPQIPPLETRLGLRVHSAVQSLDERPTWQFEVATRIVNGQNNVARSLGEIVTPGFTTVDLRGFWQVNKYVLLTAAVENVGDILYREHLDPVASTQFRALTGIPVAPLYRPGTNFVFASQVTY